MSPKVYSAFSTLASSYFEHKTGRSVLEIGASNQTLLSIPCFHDWEKTALNFAFKANFPKLEKMTTTIGNSNSINFDDKTFDCIMSSSVLEHDKYFWRSVCEMRRVLTPNGLLIVGVPIFMDLPTDWKNTTLTFKRHGKAYNADFYRFSEQAVREVVFEDFDIYGQTLVRRYPNPYLIVAGTNRE